MGTGKDKKPRETADDKYVKGFIRDIKKNGLAYVRSPKIVQCIKKADSDIQFIYDKEDDIYKAYYNKKDWYIVDQVTYDAMKSMIDNLTIENKKLSSKNRELRKTEKHLRRVIKSYKDEKEAAKNKKSKTYYKNGKRGSKYNGWQCLYEIPNLFKPQKGLWEYNVGKVCMVSI